MNKDNNEGKKKDFFAMAFSKTPKKDQHKKNFS
jgi:hypothetical protein